MAPPEQSLCGTFWVPDPGRHLSSHSQGSVPLNVALRMVLLASPRLPGHVLGGAFTPGVTVVGHSSPGRDGSPAFSDWPCPTQHPQAAPEASRSFCVLVTYSGGQCKQPGGAGDALGKGEGWQHMFPSGPFSSDSFWATGHLRVFVKCLEKQESISLCLCCQPQGATIFGYSIHTNPFPLPLSARQ